jgi:hypothetical protein
MKRNQLSRLDELLAPLDCDETHALCQRLWHHYREKAAPRIERFWAEGGDVFYSLVLDALLSHSESLEALARLRLVCKQWSAWVLQLPHVKLGANRWSPGVYKVLLKYFFTRVSALTSHPKILEAHCPRHFGRITWLHIEEPGPCQFRAPVAGDDTIDVSQWCQLRTLVVPHCDYELAGLATLTALTRLDVLGRALGSVLQQQQQQAALYQLTNLRHLSLRRASRNLDPVHHLPSLRWLESDQAHYFVHYTGDGALDGWPPMLAARDQSGDDTSDFDADEHVSEDDDEQDLLQADFAPYCGGSKAGFVRHVALQGHWCGGVFTGAARLLYGDEYEFFEGHLVNGLREGAGFEGNSRETRVFRGHWHQGLRHGTGTQCRYRGATFTGAESALHPLALEEWVHGELRATTPL